MIWALLRNEAPHLRVAGREVSRPGPPLGGGSRRLLGGGRPWGGRAHADGSGGGGAEGGGSCRWCLLGFFEGTVLTAF